MYVTVNEVKAIQESHTEGFSELVIGVGDRIARRNMVVNCRREIGEITEIAIVYNTTSTLTSTFIKIPLLILHCTTCRISHLSGVRTQKSCELTRFSSMSRVSRTI